MRRETFRQQGLLALSLGLLGAATLLGGCADVSEPGTPRVVPAVLQLSGHPTFQGEGAGGSSSVTWTVSPGDGTIVPRRVITAPEAVEAGKPFTVVVETIGDGGCWRPERQDVTIGSMTVELEPYDAHSGAQTCTMILLYLRHESTLTLDEPGEWSLRVTGRRVTFGGGAPEIGVTAEQRITVR